MSCGSEKKRRDKSFFCLNFFAVSFLLSSVFLFFSCDNFNEPVREFFDYYTNNAAIESVSVPESIGVYNGMNVIESNSDKEVIFYLRNPKNYKIGFEFSGPDSAIPEFSPEQDLYNTNLAKYSFSKEMLLSVETNAGNPNKIMGSG